MLTTMRMARLWMLWLAVLTIGAVVPVWALAAGRVLTPQDSISIKVVNQPDMDTTTRVETDGTISFPYVGRIRAAGLSEDQLAHAIERQLAARQIVTDPHVLVEITTFGTQASVQGQVGVPGVYTLDRPTNLTQLLSRAGGLRDAALGGTVTVRRAGGADPEVRFQGRSGRARALAPICGSPITMRFLSTWRRFTIIYGYVGHTGRISSASSYHGPASDLDWRRIGGPRIGMAHQDQAQVRQRANLRSPGFT